MTEPTGPPNQHAKLQREFKFVGAYSRKRQRREPNTTTPGSISSSADIVASAASGSPRLLVKANAKDSTESSTASSTTSIPAASATSDNAIPFIFDSAYHDNPQYQLPVDDIVNMPPRVTEPQSLSQGFPILTVGTDRNHQTGSMGLLYNDLMNPYFYDEDLVPLPLDDFRISYQSPLFPESQKKSPGCQESPASEEFSIVNKTGLYRRNDVRSFYSAKIPSNTSSVEVTIAPSNSRHTRTLLLNRCKPSQSWSYLRYMPRHRQ